MAPAPISYKELMEKENTSFKQLLAGIEIEIDTYEVEMRYKDSLSRLKNIICQKGRHLYYLLNLMACASKMTSTSITSESESFSEYENININIKCETETSSENEDEENLKTSSSKKEKVVKTESKNAETGVSDASASLPAFVLAGEKKFEKMRDVKDSKTIYIYISLVK